MRGHKDGCHRNPTQATTEISPVSENNPISERCPICKDKECKVHLLARFDASGDEGALGVGLTDGPLYDVNEIEETLQHARLAWVRSMRTTGKPQAPRWIVKERGLRDYFESLGGMGHFDLEAYDSDEDAADDLRQHTDTEHVRAWEFLDAVLYSCGWLGEKTDEECDIPLRSTTYLSWWAFEPSQIAKRFRAKLRRILSEAPAR
jgi:hypothetical protein